MRNKALSSDALSGLYETVRSAQLLQRESEWLWRKIARLILLSGPLCNNINGWALKSNRFDVKLDILLSVTLVDCQYYPHTPVDYQPALDVS